MTDNETFDAYLLQLSALPLYCRSLSADNRHTALQKRLLTALDSERKRLFTKRNEELLDLARELDKKLTSKFQRLNQITKEAQTKEDDALRRSYNELLKIEQQALQILTDGATRILTTDPSVAEVSSSAEFNRAFAELRRLSAPQMQIGNLASRNVEVASEIAVIFDEIDALIAEYQTRRKRLICKRDFETVALNFENEFFQKQTKDDAKEIDAYWSTLRQKRFEKIDELEKATFEAIFSTPISPEKERRFFEILTDPIYERTADPRCRDLNRELTEICGSKQIAFEGVPIASVSCRYGANGYEKTFAVPLELEQDAFYFVKRTNEAERQIRDFLQNFIFQALKNVELGGLDVYVVDPEFSGDFFAPFRQGLLGIETLNFKLENVALRQDFERVLDELKKHVVETIQTLAPDETLRSRNATNPGVKNNRKLLIVNSFPLFYGENRSQTEDAIKRLCDLAYNAKRCGITILCYGDLSLWEKFENSSSHGFEQITSFEISPVSRKIVEQYVRFADPAFQILGAKTFEVDSERIKRLIRFFAVSLDKRDDSLDFEEELRSVKSGVFGLLSDKETRVPIGRNLSGGTTEWICSSGGEFPGQTIIVGATGSGKSNLLHVMTTYACYLYSPKELRLYLIDLKKGVEFQRYANWRLPHAKLIATEGDVEIALGALRDIFDNFNKRSSAFRNAGAESLPVYRRENPNVTVPRTVVVIDEFHVLFSDDNFREEAEKLINEIIAQGRSAGFHLVLATQNLSRVSRTIIDNVSTRIALKCEESALNGLFASSPDALKEFRKPKRPGEAVLAVNNGAERFRSPLVDRTVQEKILKQCLEASQNIGFTETPLVYDGAKFPNPDSKYYRAALNECAGNEFKLLLGESDRLTSGVFLNVQNRYGENIFLVDEESERLRALYWTLAESLNFRSSAKPFDVYLYDEEKTLAPLFQNRQGTLKVADTYDGVGDLIFDVVRRLKEREQRKDPDVTNDKILLILTKVEQLTGLDKIRNRDVSSDSSRKIEEPETRIGRRDLSSLRVNFGARNIETDSVSNTQEALNKILSEGWRFGIHTFVACNSAKFALKNLNVRNSDFESLFRHVVCGKTSEENSQLCFGSLKATKLNERRVLYSNRIQLSTFRPYYKNEQNDGRIMEI